MPAVFLFSLFLLFSEIESLKGIMGLGISLSGCLHSSKINTKNIKNALTRAFISEKRVFVVFVKSLSVASKSV